MNKIIWNSLIVTPRVFKLLTKVIKLKMRKIGA
jgi:hypothetical protein